MFPITFGPIPQWLNEEIKDYFIDFPFVPKTILDIGANIGAFTKHVQTIWPQASVIACEPMPFNVVHLRKNSLPNTTIISAAIRKESGIDNIYIGDNFVTGGFVDFGRQLKETLLVECLTAKELPSCELIKIDTEGCEVEILTNLNLDNTKAILLEYHSEDDCTVIKQFLNSNFDLVKESGDVNLGTLVFLSKLLTCDKNNA